MEYGHVTDHMWSMSSFTDVPFKCVLFLLISQDFRPRHPCLPSWCSSSPSSSACRTSVSVTLNTSARTTTRYELRYYRYELAGSVHRAARVALVDCHLFQSRNANRDLSLISDRHQGHRGWRSGERTSCKIFTLQQISGKYLNIE